MGFSTALSSFIVMVGLLITFSLVASTSIWCTLEVSNVAKKYVNLEKMKLDVKLELQINYVNESACNITVRNLGSRIIFFKSQRGFRWNTIVFSYWSSSWRSYLIENFTVLKVKVINSSVSFKPENHSFIAPGEEAIIYFKLPEDAPAIPQNAVFTVAFISHYGVSAVKEGVRT